MNLRGGMFVQGAELAKSIKARVVTVIPGRLERVSADGANAAKLEAVRPVADVRALHLPENVRLASARRARARAPEFFQRNVAFLAIAPGQGKFLADDIDAKGVKGHLNEELRTKIVERRTEKYGL